MLLIREAVVLTLAAIGFTYLVILPIIVKAAQSIIAVQAGLAPF